MKKEECTKLALLLSVMVMSMLFAADGAHAAYNHFGDVDSEKFRSAYPAQVGTKLDSCTLCHRGTPPEVKPTLGSCQYCHDITKYGVDLSEETLQKTLNPYGMAYKNQWPESGRTVAALLAIGALDSDNDQYSNASEILADTFPGDSKDTPANVPAPALVLSLPELEKMARHTQFLLMNASKSDDSYTEYAGVALESLIKALMSDSATGGITVYSPDGFATYHPFNPSSNLNSYHVFGIYPAGTFYYDERADVAVYPPDPPKFETGGWCDYRSPLALGRANGSDIFNAEGLKLMLAFTRDGEPLVPGELNPQNKLDGEGPFRVVPPQKRPGWPDQRSSSTNQSVIWPYDKNADHNAGFASRSVTMIKVDPLPSGTTDINTMEAGWPYIDAEKIVVYGSINPVPFDQLNANLDTLIGLIQSQHANMFKNKGSQKALCNKIEAIKKQVAVADYSGALEKLKEDILKKMDGYLSGAVDPTDWIADLSFQKQLGSQIQIIWIQLVILGA